MASDTSAGSEQQPPGLDAGGAGADQSYQALMRRVRQGDQQAAEALVDQLGPQIRRVIRRRLRGHAVRAVADSADVCQSAFVSLLLGCDASQVDQLDDASLVRFFSTIAQRKLISVIRRETAQRRDRRRQQQLGQVGEITNERTGSPAESLMQQDLLEQIRKSLAENERALFEWRRQGRSWQEIAQLTAGEPATLRKRLSRGLLQAAAQLAPENFSS